MKIKIKLKILPLLHCLIKIIPNRTAIRISNSSNKSKVLIKPTPFKGLKYVHPNQIYHKSFNIFNNKKPSKSTISNSSSSPNFLINTKLTFSSKKLIKMDFSPNSSTKLNISSLSNKITNFSFPSLKMASTNSSSP